MSNLVIVAFVFSFATEITNSKVDSHRYKND